MNTRVLLALAGVGVLAACGSDKKNPMEPGNDVTSYSATFTGTIARTITGQSAFGSDNADEEIGFGLAMADSENQASDDMIVFYRANAGVPGTGPLSIADYVNTPDDEIPGTQLVGWAFLDMDAADPVFCASTGGSVNVQSSSSNRLKGTFTMTMDCGGLASQSEFETTVTGSFDAAGGSVVIPNG